MKFSQDKQSPFFKDKGILKSFGSMPASTGHPHRNRGKSLHAQGYALTAPETHLNTTGQHSKHPIHLKLVSNVFCTLASRPQQQLTAQCNMTLGALRKRNSSTSCSTRDWCAFLTPWATKKNNDD